MGRVQHWDEVEEHRIEGEVIAGRHQDPGAAAGSVEVGRFRVDPERQSTPAHVEGGEEEITLVVSGGGWSWQDVEAYEVRAGDVLLHRREEEPHTLVGAGRRIPTSARRPRAASRSASRRRGRTASSRPRRSRAGTCAAARRPTSSRATSAARPART